MCTIVVLWGSFWLKTAGASDSNDLSDLTHPREALGKEHFEKENLACPGQEVHSRDLSSE